MNHEKIKMRRRIQERDKKRKNAKYMGVEKQIYIAITRFNDETWKENKLYREQQNLKGCLYGSPREITHNIPNNHEMYVLEMNNSTNEIVGLGKIVNNFNCKIHRKHVYKIYKDRNYSRYVYYGNKRIDKSEFSQELKLICWFLEWILFYGYGPVDEPKRGTHFKRGMGINKLPSLLLKEYNNRLLNLDKQIKYYFDSYFHQVDKIEMY